jgi:FAD/FMN-containing dehydrogenase
LSSPSLMFAALRGLGVDPRLTVCHQTWCFPREHATEFMDLYWSTMQRYPGIERCAEQQDLIALRSCRWPAHATWGNGHGSALLTPSLAVRRGSTEQARAEAFFRELSRVAFARNPRFKLMLLKQAACDDGLLREMHSSYIARLRELKRQVDPNGVITSKLLLRLLQS